MATSGYGKGKATGYSDYFKNKTEGEDTDFAYAEGNTDDPAKKLAKKAALKRRLKVKKAVQ